MNVMGLAAFCSDILGIDRVSLIIGTNQCTDSCRLYMLRMSYCRKENRLNNPCNELEELFPVFIMLF